jgi:hypothetical protein
MIQAYYAHVGGANLGGSTFISKKMKMKMKMKEHMRKKKKMKNQDEHEADEEEDEDEEAYEDEEEQEEEEQEEKTKWIRPAPRASGLRPQSDNVVFPPHMRSVKRTSLLI